MQTFLAIALSFPTVVFSVLLMVAVSYWLLTLVGLFEAQVLDLGGDAIGDASGDAGDGGEIGGMAGVLLKFGLDGLPIALVVTGVALIAWTACYFLDFLVLRPLDSDLLRLALSIGALLLAPILALPFAGAMLQPFKALFRNTEGLKAAALLGREATVRSPYTDAGDGEAELDDGGAGLILKVRSDERFARGERVVLVEYLAAANAYRVIRA